MTDYLQASLDALNLLDEANAEIEDLKAEIEDLTREQARKDAIALQYFQERERAVEYLLTQPIGRGRTRETILGWLSEDE